ncbi:MAG: tRNA uracil 4-sulfurtransferase ThiI [Eubacteriales bacterium]
MSQKYAIVLKYGELALKGLNRGRFENLLIKRVKQLLAGVEGEFTVRNSQSTLVVRGDQSADMRLAAEKMKKVFGVVSVCFGFECGKGIDEISGVIRENISYLLGNAKTFRCTSKRGDKSYPLTSPEICEICGHVVLGAAPGVSVNLKDPQAVIYIEIRDVFAFVHAGGEKGAGGLPVSSGGSALLLLSGGIDSPVAGYMVAKRGVSVDAVYFESPPYTGEAAREKVISLAGVLAGYTGCVRLYCISVTEIQNAIYTACPEKLFTLVLRRFMMRLSQRLAEDIGAAALVTGESLGQVASQTIQSLAVTDSVVTLPVFRPCIGLDKEEIVTAARSIGTFDISSLPYEDCCTVFVPKHPNLIPKPRELTFAESSLDIGALVEEAYLTKVLKVIYGK